MANTTTEITSEEDVDWDEEKLEQSRRWSRQSNDKAPVSPTQVRREKMLLRRASTTKAVQSLQASHAKRAASLCSFLEKCRNDPHLTDDSPILKFLHIVPARDLSSAFDLPTANNSMCIFDILRIFHNHKYVMLRDWRSTSQEEEEKGGSGSERVSVEMVWHKAAFTEVALQSDDLFEPVSTIADIVPEIPTVTTSDTLDLVLQTMCLTGSEHVATVNDQGLITGVLSFDKIYESLINEIEVLAGLGDDEPNVKCDAEPEDERLKIRNAKDRERTRSRLANNRRLGGIRQAATTWIDAPFTELLVLVVLLVDVSASILEIAGGIGPEGMELTGIQNPLTAINGTTLIVFVFEASLRLFSLQGSIVWRPLDLVDTVIILISAVIFALTIADIAEPSLKGLVSLGRILRLMRLIKFAKRLRKIVGANKSRYQKDGFDLDLTYITPSCIAMSLPATGAEAHFRNPIDEVQRFFNTMHPSHFLIFNLCAERTYDAAMFGGSIERIQVEDHNPPRMDQLVSFIQRVASFLEQDPDNIFAVHCKGGKGRTGVMVCAWLMYSTYCQSADAAMEFFAKLRTGRQAKAVQGVSGAGQRQYLKYFDMVLQEGGYRTNRLVLDKIVMKTCPRMDTDGGCDPWFSIEENGVKVFDWAAHAGSLENMKAGRQEIVFGDLNLALFGDVRVRFFDRDYMPRRDEAMFYFWFHTGFINATPLVLSKPNIDVAWADKRCKIFSDRFQVECHFARIPTTGDNPDTESRAHSSMLNTPVGGVSQHGSKAYMRTSVLRQSKSVCRTELGPWIQVQAPSFRIQELSRKYKGMHPTEKGVIDASEELQSCQLEPLDHNFCPATGSPVLHRSVRMYGHDGASETTSFPQMPNMNLAMAARRKVSGNKRRFVEDGFDLDLTYITPRMIAMGFPSSGLEGKYRNDEGAVYKFFQQRHAEHYLIFNLCDERSYALQTFLGAVVRYPFTDHEPPALELLLLACAHIHIYLQANQDNVVAVHCKAGKGRTGVVTVASLMYAGLYVDAGQAKKFYDMRRTFNHHGLTIRSQIRYVYYFREVLMRLCSEPETVTVTQSSSPTIVLHRIRFNTIPHFDLDGGCDPIVRVLLRSDVDHQPSVIFGTDSVGVQHVTPAAKTVDVSLPQVQVAGDFAIQLIDQDLLCEQRMGVIWLHSMFVTCPPDEVAGIHRELSDDECAAEGLPSGSTALLFKKEHIDGAAKDVRDAKFDPDFNVEVFFSAPRGERGCPLLHQDRRRNSAQDSHVAAHLLDRARDKFRREGMHSPPGQTKLSYEQWIVKHWTGSDFGEYGHGIRLTRQGSVSGQTNNSRVGRSTARGRERSKSPAGVLGRSMSAVSNGGKSPFRGTFYRRQRELGSPLNSASSRRYSPVHGGHAAPRQRRPSAVEFALTPRASEPTLALRTGDEEASNSDSDDSSLPLPIDNDVIIELARTDPHVKRPVPSAATPSQDEHAVSLGRLGNGEQSLSSAVWENSRGQRLESSAGESESAASSPRVWNSWRGALVDTARSGLSGVSAASSTAPWILGRDTHCTLKLNVERANPPPQPNEEFRRRLEKDLAKALNLSNTAVSCDKVASIGKGCIEAAVAFFDDSDRSWQTASTTSSPLLRIGAMVEALIEQSCDVNSELLKQSASQYIESVQLSETLTAALFE